MLLFASPSLVTHHRVSALHQAHSAHHTGTHRSLHMSVQLVSHDCLFNSFAKRTFCSRKHTGGESCKTQFGLDNHVLYARLRFTNTGRNMMAFVRDMDVATRVSITFFYLNWFFCFKKTIMGLVGRAPRHVRLGESLENSWKFLPGAELESGEEIRKSKIRCAKSHSGRELHACRVPVQKFCSKVEKSQSEKYIFFFCFCCYFYHPAYRNEQRVGRLGHSKAVVAFICCVASFVACTFQSLACLDLSVALGVGSTDKSSCVVCLSFALRCRLSRRLPSPPRRRRTLRPLRSR